MIQERGIAAKAANIFTGFGYASSSATIGSGGRGSIVGAGGGGVGGAGGGLGDDEDSEGVAAPSFSETLMEMAFGATSSSSSSSSAAATTGIDGVDGVGADAADAERCGAKAGHGSRGSASSSAGVVGGDAFFDSGVSLVAPPPGPAVGVGGGNRRGVRGAGGRGLRGIRSAGGASVIGSGGGGGGGGGGSSAEGYENIYRSEAANRADSMRFRLVPGRGDESFRLRNAAPGGVLDAVSL